MEKKLIVIKQDKWRNGEFFADIFKDNGWKLETINLSAGEPVQNVQKSKATLLQGPKHFWRQALSTAGSRNPRCTRWTVVPAGNPLLPSYQVSADTHGPQR